MNKIIAFIAAHWVSWVIEISILSVVAFITITEVRKTNEQTRQMLTAVSNFAAARGEAVGGAIDSIANQAKNIELGGKINVKDGVNKALELWKDRGNKD